MPKIAKPKPVPRVTARAAAGAPPPVAAPAPLPVEERALEPAGPEPLFGYAEASRYLSIPVGSLYAMVSRAEIPFLRLGARTVRFRRSELEAWLASNANRPASSAA